VHERIARPLAVGTTLLRVVRRSEVSLLAAAIAYYALVSLFPLLLLSLAAASILGGEAFADTIVSSLSGVLSPSGETLVRDSLTSARGRGGATLVGIGLLVWGGLKLFRGLDIAFSMVYGDHTVEPLPVQIRNAVTALLAVGVAISATILVGIAARALGIPIGVLGLPAVLTAAFLPLFVIFPDADLSLREALPGAVFAAVGWTVLSAAFQVYAAAAESAALYGVVGGVLLLVTWFYLGGIILLLGVILNGVLAGDVEDGASGDRQLQHDPLRDIGQQMSEAGPDDATDDRTASRQADVDVAELREEIDELEARIEERTLHRDEIERDLKRYVRKRVRRGHATGWGPYLVLLYGTVMTLGAFYFLSGWVAFLTMIVIWLSTLGLYALMVLVGVTVNTLGLPGKLLEKLRDLRR
jgi:YihY family inner membrane protein